MIGRMVFSEIVGKVVHSFVPFYVELVLGDLITKPVIFHVPWFRSFDSHFGMDKTVRSGIVCFYGVFLVADAPDQWVLVLLQLQLCNCKIELLFLPQRRKKLHFWWLHILYGLGHSRCLGMFCWDFCWFLGRNVLQFCFVLWEALNMRRRIRHIVAYRLHRTSR